MSLLRSVILLLTLSLSGVETAAFPGQSQEEIDRLLHIVGVSLAHDLFNLPSTQVVVGGGPTGVELRFDMFLFFLALSCLKNFLSSVANCTIS